VNTAENPQHAFAVCHSELSAKWVLRHGVTKCGTQPNLTRQVARKSREYPSRIRAFPHPQVPVRPPTAFLAAFSNGLRLAPPVTRCDSRPGK
jgi:hypothetical protein